MWAYDQDTNGTGKTGEMAPKDSLLGKTQGIWKFCQNTGNFVKTQGILSKHRETGNFVISSCKFSDSKSKAHCDICPPNLFFTQKLDRSAKSV